MSAGWYEDGRYVTQGMQVCAAVAEALDQDAIITEYVCPPIPVHDMDWQATRKGYDEGDPIGRGSTKQDAINDLLDMENK